MLIQPGELLAQIDSPADLKKISRKTSLSKFATNSAISLSTMFLSMAGTLEQVWGVVELTVALHYVLNTPEDQLVWDVGHQAYGHKNPHRTKG